MTSVIYLTCLYFRKWTLLSTTISAPVPPSLSKMEMTNTHSSCPACGFSRRLIKSAPALCTRSTSLRGKRSGAKPSLTDGTHMSSEQHSAWLSVAQSLVNLKLTKSKMLVLAYQNTQDNALSFIFLKNKIKDIKFKKCWISFIFLFRFYQKKFMLSGIFVIHCHSSNKTQI